jgi:hypothetical protein
LLLIANREREMLHGPIAIVSPAASTGWAPSVDAMTTDRLACRRAADRQ